jgi:hypothetical protein
MQQDLGEREMYPIGDTMKVLAAIIIATLCSLPLSAVEPKTVKADKNGIPTTNGIITPIDLDMRNFYVRNSAGTVEVKLSDDVIVGIQERIKDDKLLSRKFEYKVGKEAFSYDLPKDLYVRVRFSDWKRAKFALDNPDRTLWDGKIYIAKQENHLPTENELWLSGKLTAVKGREKTISVGDKSFKVVTTGHNGQEMFMGLGKVSDIKPYIQRVFAYGAMKGNVFYADEISIMRKEDASKNDDPKLPRVLFIGDSISGNYDRAFRGALAGKANIYHPPVNCGPATNGAEHIVNWLGPYEQKGYHWDAISFNFGQWDLAKGSKETYQKALHAVMKELVKTEAKLIYVTTTPIPGGYGEVAGKPVKMKKSREGKMETWVPGKHKGVMKDYINPWAMEVIKQYPQISVSDQHAILWNEKASGDWLKIGGINRKGANVDKSITDDYGDNHIPRMQSQMIGRLLARQVLDILGKTSEPLNVFELNEKDFGKKARATNRGIDFADLKDLLHNDERLRKYNHEQK